MPPVLEKCPVCKQPWDAPSEAQVLTMSTQATVKAALDVLIAALYGDDPATRAWADDALRGYAALLRKHQGE
jgi:hypothetical protein